MGAVGHFVIGKKKGHIHADLSAQGEEGFGGKFEFFEIVQGEEQGGRIAAGTAESTAGWNAFFELNLVFEKAAGVGLEDVDGFQNGISFGGKGGAVERKRVGALKRKRILEKPGAHKNRVEEVVARGVPAKNGEEQIHLRGTEDS